MGGRGGKQCQPQPLLLSKPSAAVLKSKAKRSCAMGLTGFAHPGKVASTHVHLLSGGHEYVAMRVRPLCSRGSEEVQDL